MASTLSESTCTLPWFITAGLNSHEKIWSKQLQRLLHETCAENSYGAAAKFLNSALYREEDESLALSTLGDFERRSAGEMDSKVQQATNFQLSRAGFDYNTGKLIDPVKLNMCLERSSARCCALPFSADNPIDVETIKNALLKALKSGVKLNLGKLIDQDSVLSACVSISIDEVLSKHQTDQRTPLSVKLSQAISSLSAPRQRFVSNACLTIQAPNRKPYHIAAPTVDEALKRALAYLIEHNLLGGYHLVCFTDGAKNLHQAINTLFGFFEPRIIIDWFHIAKRCGQLLSQACTGQIEEKRVLLDRILGFLWHGDVDGAINLLSSILNKQDDAVRAALYPKQQDAEDVDSAEDTRYIPKIKNEAKLTEFINYLTGKEPLMACYSVRAYRKLKVSSNMAEKSNDMLVAHRQKKKGMSWSQDGSSGLAIITAFIKNGNMERWLSHKQFSFADEPLICFNDPTNFVIVA